MTIPSYPIENLFEMVLYKICSINGRINIYKHIKMGVPGSSSKTQKKRKNTNPLLKL
jgi:hypothetical protein